MSPNDTQREQYGDLVLTTTTTLPKNKFPPSLSYTHTHTHFFCCCRCGYVGYACLRSALHGYSPEDISEELSVAIRGLCSFVKLANATILASEVPVQILYEKHILDKEVAIAFHTMDDGHKKVMAATARLLEEYFTRGDDEEEEEGERESSKDK